jgi:hypothetical protein
MRPIRGPWQSRQFHSSPGLKEISHSDSCIVPTAHLFHAPDACLIIFMRDPGKERSQYHFAAWR